MLPLLLLALGADPKPADTPADVAIHKYLRAQVAELDKNFLDGAKTKEEWHAKRPKLKEQMFDMLGLWPLPEKTDLRATVTGTLDVDDVTIEKIHFQSRPGLYVTANLYRPRVAVKGKKYPAIVYACGHSNQGRDGNKTAYQRHGMWFASNGYVCLITDTLQLGEVAGKHHGTYNLDRFWWHSRGYTPAGVECWNGIRAVDYLISRPDVDGEKIGATGISGGGAATVWIAATDDRVKVAIPVSGMSDLQEYVGERVINGHCDCMFAYNPYRWEWTTILALFAPKPLMFANSDADTIFPMPGNRRIAERMRKCYELLGAKDSFEAVVTVGKHEDTPALRKASFRFFNEHLKGDPKAKADDTEFAKIDGKLLRVFPEDGDLPKDAINAKADETFVKVADVKLPAKPEDFAAWKKGLVKELKEKCFGSFPEKMPAAKELNRDGLTTAWTGDDGVVFRTKRHLLRKQLPQELPFHRHSIVLLNADDDPEKVCRIGSTLSDLESDTLAARGIGGGKWTTKNPPNTIERSFALAGTTVDTGRLRDLLGYLASLKDINKVRLAGKGQAGVIAAYAALLMPEMVEEVILHDPPTTHDDGPHFLGVRKVLDIPEALGLLAPDVAVTIMGKASRSKAFDKTEAIFKLSGAKGKLKRE